MIDLNKLAEELHAAAVEKGFWDVEDAEIKHIAKMHSELSEAIQEDRCGRPMLYVDDIEVEARITDPAMFDGRKPEGVAAELADFVMMVLDWAKQKKITIIEMHNVTEVEDIPLCHLVNNMHEGIILVSNDWVEMTELHYGFMVGCVETWLKACDINLWEIIRLKMEYNRSRPALHGRLY